MGDLACWGAGVPVPFATCRRASRLRPRRRIWEAIQADAGVAASPVGSEARTVDPRYHKFLDAWDKTFVNVDEEVDGYEIVDVEGVIPPELRGTLYRNGPNAFDAVDHPYDADGFIASLIVEDGKAWFRSRFVETAERRVDRSSGRTVFRGTFLTQRPKGQNFGDMHVKNTSNTNVLFFNGALYSFFEAGQPYRLDPMTLDTIGITDMAGTTPVGLPFDLGNEFSNNAMGAMARFAQKMSGEEIFSGQGHPLPAALMNAGGWAMTAHPSICPTTGRLVTFSYTMRIGVLDPREISFPPMYTEVRFMEFDSSRPDESPVVSRTIKLPGYAFLHDFALTENHYVIFLNPVTVDTGRYLSGKAPAAGSVKWVKGKPTRLMVVPRDPDETDESRSFTLPASFVFHHAGAYEDGDDLVIDSVHYPSMPAVGKASSPEQGLDPNAAFASRLKRTRVENWQSEEASISIEELFDQYLEMVSTNPGTWRHRHVFGYTSDFENARIGIAKVDTGNKEASSTWFPSPRQFLLEPVFAPRKGAASQSEEHGDDEGWLISQFFDSETSRSGFFIFDSSDLGAGPIAKLWLRAPLPSALHGTWVSGSTTRSDGGDVDVDAHIGGGDLAR
jgi:all-trans-8'-apo-beta-carotenal 15,15'-oxygenase